MNGLAFNRCGQMDALRTIDPKVRMAQVLYTNLVIILEGVRYSGYLRFPLTAITKTGLLRAVVAPCTASGFLEGGGQAWVHLGQERVIGPEALPVVGRGEVWLPTGKGAILELTYGAVLAMPEGDGDWLVGAVNAKGTITF